MMASTFSHLRMEGCHKAFSEMTRLVDERWGPAVAAADMTGTHEGCERRVVQSAPRNKRTAQTHNHNLHSTIIVLYITCGFITFAILH